MTSAERAFLALAPFNGCLSALTDAVAATVPDRIRLPKKHLDELLAIAGRARGASDALARSFTIIDQTVIDIVDMQVRLRGETAKLASALTELGSVIERQHFVREAFGDELVALDEAAHLVAAAVFPSAVQGLQDVNVRLWDFQRVQWMRYADTLASVVQRGKLTAAQRVRIQQIADDVAAAFEAVNTLLNDLADSRASDAKGISQRLARAPVALTDALREASDGMTPELKVFSPIINASVRIAGDVAKMLAKLVIPIYPTHEQLGECGDCIDKQLYDRLSGSQMFALLNILARMCATQASGQPLLTGRSPRVFQVFPDRIYLEIDRSLIDDVRRDTATFAEAPASLHRFRDGSFKQKIFDKGNLQVCYAARGLNRVVVDADIDLYREPIPHLFGEVLVNHLTGSTTDQYAVRRILDEQRVAPVGQFQLLA